MLSSIERFHYGITLDSDISDYIVNRSRSPIQNHYVYLFAGFSPSNSHMPYYLVSYLDNGLVVFWAMIDNHYVIYGLFDTEWDYLRLLFFLVWHQRLTKYLHKEWSSSHKEQLYGKKAKKHQNRIILYLNWHYWCFQ